MENYTFSMFLKSLIKNDNLKIGKDYLINIKILNSYCNYKEIILSIQFGIINFIGTAICEKGSSFKDLSIVDSPKEQTPELRKTAIDIMDKLWDRLSWAPSIVTKPQDKDLPPLIQASHNSPYSSITCKG